LNAFILGLILYALIDLQLHPTCMPFQLLLVPPGLAMSGSSILSWIVVFRKVRDPSGDRLTALAWGALSALIAPFASIGTLALVCWAGELMVSSSLDVALMNLFFLANVLIMFAGGLVVARTLVLWIRRRRQPVTDR
jgi:hypothetical protein